MGLLSIFKRADAASNATASEPGDAVQRARTRARQRLIGAAVLVVIGIIGFPLVFETQPRPIPVDIPIEVPRKEGAPALVMPAARAPVVNSSASAVPAIPAAPIAAPDVITESREEAGREVAAPASAAAPKSEPKPPVAAAVEPKPAPGPETKPPAASGDGARARALLDGKPVAATATDSGRFVVQVGAFADAGAARETRLKAEKLGLKTYTQVASTASGNRIRVRVGPFGTRGEADKAMAKAKGAGLSAVVLTL
ncbi:MAG: SPOR domain-containing protein [Pseudomonadota bacterium]